MDAPVSVALQLRCALADLDRDCPASEWLKILIGKGLDRLPYPGSGATLQRWQALAIVGEYDLSLAKLYEGHTDAIAILNELGDAQAHASERIWAVWAAESPHGRTVIERNGDREVLLRGRKQWCSGADSVSHGLLTAWCEDGSGPQLVQLSMDQPTIEVCPGSWRAIAMRESASVDVVFRGAMGQVVGGVGDYLKRPGFWHGGAGVAACWYGGALALGQTLQAADMQSSDAGRNAFRAAALGKVDVSLRSAAALLREAAAWIDDHPNADASEIALRTRLAVEQTAKDVMDETGRALGASPFCFDRHFARIAADLPVFIRQSHAERDFAALGQRMKEMDPSAWNL